jgi:hypothetical protein
MTGTTTPQTRPDPRLEWHPTAEDVEAIVAEMRPLIDTLAVREAQRLSRLTGLTGPPCAHRPSLRRVMRHGGRGIRTLNEELGEDVLVALLNENSPSPRRRATTVHRKLAWAQTIAARRRLGAA